MYCIKYIIAQGLIIIYELSFIIYYLFIKAGITPRSLAMLSYFCVKVKFNKNNVGSKLYEAENKFVHITLRAQRDRLQQEKYQAIYHPYTQSFYDLHYALLHVCHTVINTICSCNNHPCVKECMLDVLLACGATSLDAPI